MSSGNDNKLKVAYWSIRGLGAPLRMMCEYAGADYEPVNYELKGEPGAWDASAWFSVKPALKERNPLMNLPYVIDGDRVVTQSNACLLYLGRKFGLGGKNEDETVRMEQALCQAFDLRNDAVKAFYSSNFEEDIKGYVNKSLPGHYDKFEEWLAKLGTKYLASDEPTTADFHLWELLDQNELLAKFLERPSFLESNPKWSHLLAYYQRFKELPAIKKYLDGPLAKLPVNNKMAIFK
eukprot:TRINITY_DN893_c0_g7_i1.p1 TRINITY_DN893_c0_g7~~TRINITY_DN893_c0_g7_i1.p1  ORF type:complete len:236 (-),score=52.42 TRINITY_DN893_c0_g7_i1:61-768(-)